MNKKIALILILTCLVPAFAEEKFKGGVSVDFNREITNKAEILKDNLPVLDGKFVDLNYSINFKPLNMLTESDFKKKKHYGDNLTPINSNLAPDKYEISLQTGKIKGETNDLSEIEALLKNSPNNRELLFAYAIQLKNEKKYKDALHVADKIADVEPDFALVHFLKGDILRNMGELKKSVEEYLYTAQLNPYCADAYYNVAKILELLGNKELALDYYKTAYQINPNDAEIREIILNSYMDL